MNDLSQEPISLKAQALTILASLVLLTIVIFLVKRGHLKSGYSILWFLTAFLILILSIFKYLLIWLANLSGVEYAPALIFSALFVGIILILIHFSVSLSKHDRRIKKLAQENALLKYQLGAKTKKLRKAVKLS